MRISQQLTKIVLGTFSFVCSLTFSPENGNGQEKRVQPIFSIKNALKAISLDKAEFVRLLEKKGFNAIPDSDYHLLDEMPPYKDIHPIDDVFQNGKLYVRSFHCTFGGYSNKSFAWSEKDTSQAASIIRDLLSAGFKQTSFSRAYPQADIFYKQWWFVNENKKTSAKITAVVKDPYIKNDSTNKISVKLIQHTTLSKPVYAGNSSGMVDSFLNLKISQASLPYQLRLSEALKISRLSLQSQIDYLSKIGFYLIDTSEHKFVFGSDTLSKKYNISLTHADDRSETLSWHQEDGIARGFLAELLRTGFIRNRFYHCCDMSAEVFTNKFLKSNIEVQGGEGATDINLTYIPIQAPMPQKIGYSSKQIVLHKKATHYDDTTYLKTATYWKNGVAIHLSDGKTDGFIKSIGVSRGEIVLLQPGEKTSKVWRIGKKVVADTIGGHLTSMEVYKDDLYFTGFDINGLYLKNNNFYSVKKENRTFTQAICVVNGDVYVTGSENNARDRSDRATYWHNGIPTYLNDSTQYTSAMRIANHGSDIFISGDQNCNGVNFGTIWENGVPIISVKDHSYNKVAFRNDDMFIAGSVYERGVRKAAIWENGVIQVLGKQGIESNAISIAFKGKDVYVVGYEKNIAKLWKNGISIDLETGLHGSSAISLLIRDNDVFVGGYQNN